MAKMRFIYVVLGLLLSLRPVLAQEGMDQAQELAAKGNYEEAYQRLLAVIDELEKELENLQGVVTHYKEEVSRLKGGRPEVVDYKYNQAANRLWASAWRLQHDGVFEKMGAEKEDCLLKAIDTFKRIVIDYPYADKAEEAQYRVGRIYYKFLKEYDLAQVELQRYLNMYPNGKYASDARGMLGRIRK